MDYAELPAATEFFVPNDGRTVVVIENTTSAPIKTFAYPLQEQVYLGVGVRNPDPALGTIPPGMVHMYGTFPIWAYSDSIRITTSAPVALKFATRHAGKSEKSIDTD